MKKRVTDHFKRIGKLGGDARAKKLTEAKRKGIAKKGAQALMAKLSDGTPEAKG